MWPCFGDQGKLPSQFKGQSEHMIGMLARKRDTTALLQDRANQQFPPAEQPRGEVFYDIPDEPHVPAQPGAPMPQAEPQVQQVQPEPQAEPQVQQVLAPPPEPAGPAGPSLMGQLARGLGYGALGVGALGLAAIEGASYGMYQRREARREAQPEGRAPSPGYRTRSSSPEMIPAPKAKVRPRPPPQGDRSRSSTPPPRPPPQRRPPKGDRSRSPGVGAGGGSSSSGAGFAFGGSHRGGGFYPR